jgi:hypothetical protein
MNKGIASSRVPIIMHHDAILLHQGEFVKAVTLRSLTPNIAEAIRKEANRKGMSLNKAVISLLENRLGCAGEKEKPTNPTP